MTLSGSVGAFGRNRTLDVIVVQKLLTAHGRFPGAADGRCGRHTVGAILAFQRAFMSEPDGRVDVNGPTWHHLHARTGPASAPRAPAPAPAPRPATMPQAWVMPPPPAERQASADGGTSYKRPVPAPPAGTVNVGLTCPTSSWMEAKLGRPRANFSSACQDMTNARLKEFVEMRAIGHLRFLGLRPALDSLQEVMTEISQQLPDLYPHLGSAGMLCCRNIRGSTTAISNHSWGTAIDISIDGQVEPMGPAQPYLGLSLIAPIFNRHGWYWGGGYANRKDCMHFECSESLVSSFVMQVA